MLTQVPTAMRRANRAVVLRHRNTFAALVMRRSVTRTFGAEDGMLGGLPTLGGGSVLAADDEPQVDYKRLGPARVLFTTAYEPTTMNDRRDASDQQPTALALIEPEVEGAFDIKDGDLVMLMPGAGVVVPYEVTNVISQVNIPPYVIRYELSAQGEMAFDPDVDGLTP